MRQIRGIWFPDGENHIPKIMDQEDEPYFAGAGVYQFRKFAASFPWIRNFRHAIDIGANVGTWSRVFSRCFGKVSAFEPIAEHRECFARNIDPVDMSHVHLFPYALGDVEGTVSLTAEHDGCMGMMHIVDEGDYQAEMKTLDSFDFEDVDYIKIDVEGYEFNVIRGAKRTIKRCHPTIILEQKDLGLSRYGNNGSPRASALLQAWGMMLEMNFGGDYIMRWPK